MKFRGIAHALTLIAGTSAVALAGVIPYPSTGTPAQIANLTATTTGSVEGYFVNFSAADLDSIALINVTTGVTSSHFFANQTTAAGTKADFGNVTAGDQLVFELFNSTLGTTVRSDANNEDGVAHAYISPFAGGLLSGNMFPAGDYVGFEDKLQSQMTDYDYNDDNFLFTNVSGTTPISQSPVPEPGSLALFGTGALGLVAGLRRRMP